MDELTTDRALLHEAKQILEMVVASYNGTPDYRSKQQGFQAVAAIRSTRPSSRCGAGPLGTPVMGFLLEPSGLSQNFKGGV